MRLPFYATQVVRRPGEGTAVHLLRHTTFDSDSHLVWWTTPPLTACGLLDGREPGQAEMFPGSVVPNGTRLCKRCVRAFRQDEYLYRVCEEQIDSIKHGMGWVRGHGARSHLHLEGLRVLCGHRLIALIPLEGNRCAYCERTYEDLHYVLVVKPPVAPVAIEGV